METSLKPLNNSSPKDAFQREALDRFLGGSDTRHYIYEVYKGRESIRYMIPDVAASQTCVDCHNANPSSPKRDYKIGDVMGGLEIAIPIETEMATAMGDIWRSIGYGFIVILGMGLVGLSFIRRVVTMPVTGLADTTGRLAVGDLTSEAHVVSDDEIGDLCRQTTRS
jgi:methyl-accepting chemotaxis protein